MKFPTIGKIFSISSLLLSAVASTSLAQDIVIEPVEAQVAKTDFIRVDHTEKNAFLQTGITSYTKGDVVVDLIGAVHIADKSYYDQLNKEFTKYEVLLFEMVGGEEIKEQLNADIEQPAKKNDLQLDFLSGMYNTMTKKLDLTGQKDGIDYSKDNFVHADLSIKEFNDLQKKKGESILKFAFQNAMEQAKQQANGKGAKQPNTMNLLKALLFGTPNDLKLTIVDTLGGGDDQVGALAGKNSVIIGDRNIKCLKVMDEQIIAGKKNIGIFYGAAHFPDMEERMIEMGFKQTNHRWLNAWNLIKAEEKKKVEKEVKKAA